MRKLLFTLLLALLPLTANAQPDYATVQAQLRKIESRMMESLKKFHGDDLGYKNLVDRYNETDDPEMKRVSFMSIWLYTDEKIRSAPKPIPADKQRALDEYQTAYAEYDKALPQLEGW